MIKKYFPAFLTLVMAGNVLFSLPANAENKVTKKGLSTNALNAQEQKTNTQNTSAGTPVPPSPTSNQPPKQVTMADINAMDFSYYTERNVTFDDYRLAGVYYYEMGDFDNAIINFQQALALKPEDEVSKGWLLAAKNSKLTIFYRELAGEDSKDEKTKSPSK